MILKLIGIFMATLAGVTCAVFVLGAIVYMAIASYQEEDWFHFGLSSTVLLGVTGAVLCIIGDAIK